MTVGYMTAVFRPAEIDRLCRLLRQKMRSKPLSAFVPGNAAVQIIRPSGPKILFKKYNIMQTQSE